MKLLSIKHKNAVRCGFFILLGMLLNSFNTTADAQQFGTAVFGYVDSASIVEIDSAISTQRASLFQGLTEDDRQVAEKIIALQDNQLKGFTKKMLYYSQEKEKEINEIRDHYQFHLVIAFYGIGLSVLLTVLGFWFKMLFFNKTLPIKLIYKDSLEKGH